MNSTIERLIVEYTRKDISLLGYITSAKVSDERQAKTVDLLIARLRELLYDSIREGCVRTSGEG